MWSLTSQSKLQTHFDAPVAPGSESKSQQALVNELVASFHEQSTDSLETITHDDIESHSSQAVKDNGDGDILPTIRRILPARDRSRDGHGRELGVQQVRGVIGKVVGAGAFDVLKVLVRSRGLVGRLPGLL